MMYCRMWLITIIVVNRVDEWGVCLSGTRVFYCSIAEFGSGRCDLYRIITGYSIYLGGYVSH